MERTLRAQLATVTGGLAPDVYANAWWDWFLNLAKEPPAQLQLMQDAMAKAADNFAFAMQAAVAEPLTPAAGDDHFGGDAWTRWPFNVYAHTYRNYADWWQKAMSNVPGVAPSNERTLEFVTRNALEAVSPANYLATNPELIEATRVVRSFDGANDECSQEGSQNSTGSAQDGCAAQEDGSQGL